MRFCFPVIRQQVSRLLSSLLCYKKIAFTELLAARTLQVNMKAEDIRADQECQFLENSIFSWKFSEFDPETLKYNFSLKVFLAVRPSCS